MPRKKRKPALTIVDRLAPCPACGGPIAEGAGSTTCSRPCARFEEMLASDDHDAATEPECPDLDEEERAVWIWSGWHRKPGGKVWVRVVTGLQRKSTRAALFSFYKRHKGGQVRLLPGDTTPDAVNDC